MELDELMQSVRKIDIISKTITKQKFSGLGRSIFKGRGITFDAVRKYEMGDDVRNINWNVTARFREPYLNTFTEDKVRKIWLLIDISGSTQFGTVNRRKIDLEIEIGATIAYSAIRKNDSVGVIFFSDKIEKLIMPVKGMSGFWHIARTMVKSEPCAGATNLDNALQVLIKLNTTGNLIFIISDFITSGYENACGALSQHNDVLAIHVYDAMEYQLPDLGWVKLLDIETGKQKWVNTSSERFRKHYQLQKTNELDLYYHCLRKSEINTISLRTNEDILEKLMRALN